MFGEKRAWFEWCQAVRLATKGTDLESRPFSKCSHCDVFRCCNKKKSCFLEYHNENYFATAGVNDVPIYSSISASTAEARTILTTLPNYAFAQS